MKKSKLSKIISGKIGKSFAIMYNRASMYKIDHPFTSKSIQELYSTVTEGLDLFSPVVIILNREQFFIEEEPQFYHLVESSSNQLHSLRLLSTSHTQLIKI